MIVLLQISGRSGWWVLGYLVPIVNILVRARWCLEMARGSGAAFFFLNPLFLVILSFDGWRYAGRMADTAAPQPALA